MCAELLLKCLPSASSSQDYLPQKRSIKPLFSGESSYTFGQNLRRFLRWCGVCVCVCVWGGVIAMVTIEKSDMNTLLAYTLEV